MTNEEEIQQLLNTPDGNGRYTGYYDLGHGVNEAEKLRQDLITALYAGWTCPDCVPTEVYCPTHDLVTTQINRLAELAHACAFPAVG